MKHILAIPIGPETTGSSRIRLYSILKELKGKVLFDVIDPYIAPHGLPSCEFCETYDVIYVQKTAYPHIINFCTNIILNSKKPKKIVYDLDDDLGTGLSSKENQIKMCMLADVIIVDSTYRLEDTKKMFPHKDIRLLKGMIDFANDKAREKKYDYTKSPETITTYGFSDVNIESTFPHLKILQDFGLKTQIMINHVPGREKYNDLCDNYIHWELEEFIKHLTKTDLCVLCHSKDELGKRKDNCRLILAMSFGIPTITSKTAAYYETLKEVNLEYLACDTKEELKYAYDILQNPLKRKEISDIFVRYAWDNNSPSKCAKEFYNLITEE